jgi:hypothetical protein
VAKPSRHYIRRGGFVLLQVIHLKQQTDDGTLDLIEMRRQLTALRSQHSDNLLIASLLNRFLVKVAFLSEPEDREHEQYLRSEFAQTIKKVQAITSLPAKGSAVTKPSK